MPRVKRILTKEIDTAINLEAVFLSQKIIIQNLSQHIGRGNGDENSLNFKRILNLLFGSKNTSVSNSPLISPTSWKDFSNTKKAKFLAEDIFFFFTNSHCVGEPFGAPFDESSISGFKKGTKELIIDRGILNRADNPVLIISHYLATTITSNAFSCGRAKELFLSAESIIKEENDKTGLADLLKEFSTIDRKNLDEKQLYDLMFVFFSIACLRRNIPVKKEESVYDEYDSFLASVFDHADVSDFKERYIPVYLTETRIDSISEPVPKTIPTLASALAENHRAIVLGGISTGKTTVLKALAVYYKYLSDPRKGNDALKWYSDEPSAELKNKYHTVTWIKGCDIGGSFHDNFRDYLSDDTVVYHAPKKGNDSCQFTRELIIIDGLDDILSVCGSRYVSPRLLFLDSLKRLLITDPNIDIVITSCEQGLKSLSNDLIDFVSETSTLIYRITPPNSKVIKAYCHKKQIDEKLQEKILQLIDNNQAISEIINTHLMLSYFIDISKRDGGIIPIRSQLQLLRDIVDINMIHSADISSDNVPINEYDIKSVLALLAIIISENSVKQNKFFSSIPIYSEKAGDSYSIEALLASPKIMALDLYLTENSCLRPLNNIASTKKQAQSLIQLLKNSHTPFVVIINDEKKQAVSLAFSSEIWQNYFAAYALANKIGIESDSSIKYLHNRIYELCSNNNYQNDSVINSWMQIIADAAILSRQSAYKYLHTLSEFAKNPSPQHRKGREFATLTILKILRNSPFLSTNDWTMYSETALSYYFYHNQLEDFDAILRFSSRRKTFCRQLFESFFQDVDSMCPIPKFIFCIGYICYRWIPFDNLSEKQSPEQLSSIAMKNIDAHSDNSNSLDVLVQKVNDYYRNYNDNRVKETTMPFFIMSVMAICSHYWIRSTKTLFTEINGRLSHEYELTINPDVNRCLIQLIGSSDWRVESIAGFALTHIISYAIDNNDCNEFSILNANSSLEAKYMRLAQIIQSDYDARIMSEKILSGDKTPFCGALRLMTVIHITADDYGKVVTCFPSEDQIVNYYKRLWETHLSAIKENKNDGGYSQRYLMLFFRICFLLGIWDEKIHAHDVDNPIIILYKIKKRWDGNNIGLKYDREEMFFEDLKKIAECWHIEIE